MEYTKIELGKGEIVLQCNDCGAYILNGKVEDIKHYPTCKPTDMTQFNHEDMADSHEEDIIDDHEKGFDFVDSCKKDFERENE